MNRETGWKPVLLFGGGHRRAENSEPAIIAGATQRFKYGGEVAEAISFKRRRNLLLLRVREEAFQFNRLAAFDGLQQMAVNRPRYQVPFAGDLLDGLPGTEAAHGVPHRIPKAVSGR